MTAKSESRDQRYDAAEWAARIELAAGYRIADMFGFSDIIWNHITLKIPHREHFLINRFGLCYDEVTASNLVTLDLDGNVIDPGSGSSDEAVNKTGFIIHSAVHAARPGIGCVMHSHAEAGLVVSVLEEGLLPMTLDALPIYGRVSYHEFEGQTVNADERQRLAESLGSNNAMILRNHGLLTTGKTVGEAFMTMYYLDRACRVQMQVLASGQSYSLASEEACRQAATEYQQFAYGQFEWPALLRLVERQAPEFKQ